jgi:hypothetical protein
MVPGAPEKAVMEVVLDIQEAVRDRAYTDISG